MDKICGATVKKKETESFDEYCHRIVTMCRDDQSKTWTWTHIASIINTNTGNDFSADKYRKQEKKNYPNNTTESIKDLPKVGIKNKKNSVQDEAQNKFQDKSQNASQDTIEDIHNIYDHSTITYNAEKGETSSSKELILTDEQLKNPKELLMAHGFDPDEFILRTASNTKSHKVTGNNDPRWYYSSRISVRPKIFSNSNFKEIKEYFEHFTPPVREPASVVTYGVKEDEDNPEYLVLPLYDFHWGRMKEEFELFNHFDINEEKERIITHFKKYVDKFRYKHFKDVYIIIGQDFFNSSFTGFTSSQKHLQSNALDFQSMFKSGCELAIEIINMFEQISGKVNIIGSLGNHAVSEEFAMFMLLEAYYRSDPRVTIDAHGAPRKYFKLGDTCIGVGHLDKERDRAYGLMQVEAQKLWAETKTHMFIAGHLHHFEVNSKQGVEIYRCPAICYHDKWTVDQGFTQNTPKTIGFIFNESDGLIENHIMYL